MCERASKQSPDLKNYSAQGLRPPVLKFLDPPLRGHAPRASLTSLLLYLKIVWIFVCSCSLYNKILCIIILDSLDQHLLNKQAWEKLKILLIDFLKIL